MSRKLRNSYKPCTNKRKDPIKVISEQKWFQYLFLEQFHNTHCITMYAQYIPLISWVRGPYGKLWTEFFPSFYGPSAKRAGHENKEGKNEDP